MYNMATESTSYTGRVKWFNNKSGFGFVTIVEGDRSGDDIFAHHSGITVGTEQYRYLVQGEYVTFTLQETQNSKHAVQAWNVRGICGGPLMCETRKEIKDTRPKRTTTTRQTRYRGGGPRDGMNTTTTNTTEYTLNTDSNNAFDS
jgi:cold shock CspA family protein